MANGDSTQEIELGAGDKKLRIRGSDFLTLVGVAVGVLMVYMLVEHKGEARDASKQFEGVVKEMVMAQREMVQEQRVQNCLIAYSQEQRERNVEFCKRLAR